MRFFGGVLMGVFCVGLFFFFQIHGMFLLSLEMWKLQSVACNWCLKFWCFILDSDQHHWSNHKIFPVTFLSAFWPWHTGRVTSTAGKSDQAFQSKSKGRIMVLKILALVLQSAVTVQERLSDLLCWRSQWPRMESESDIG